MQLKFMRLQGTFTRFLEAIKTAGEPYFHGKVNREGLSFQRELLDLLQKQDERISKLEGNWKGVEPDGQA